MALADWAYLSGINGSVHHGPTLEVPTAESAAGDFAYGFNSDEEAGNGAVALVYKPPGFNFTKGGSISALVTKVSAEGAGHSVFVLTQVGDGTATGSVSDVAYMLGIQDDPTNRLVLCKGPVSAGIPAGDPGTDNGLTRIIAKGSESVDPGDWIHVRLQAVVQTGGDVLLVAERSLSGGVVSPVFQTIPGMPDRIVDGVTEITTGSAPLSSGRAGIGWHFNATNKTAGVDYIEGARQVS
jgi:hypothetical protein